MSKKSNKELDYQSEGFFVESKRKSTEYRIKKQELAPEEKDAQKFVKDSLEKIIKFEKECTLWSMNIMSSHSQEDLSASKRIRAYLEKHEENGYLYADKEEIQTQIVKIAYNGKIRNFKPRFDNLLLSFSFAVDKDIIKNVRWEIIVSESKKPAQVNAPSK